MARNHKKLEIYHLAYAFTLDTYRLANKLPESENKNILLQLKRAVVSIPLNIAEGSSRRTNREFLRFLMYSYGSAKETSVLIDLCKDLGYVEVKEYLAISEKLDKLTAKLFLFMRDLEKRVPGKKFNFFQKLESKL